MAKNKSKSGARRKGRTVAFQVLYGLSFVPTEKDDLEDAFNENPAVLDETDAEALEFARELVTGVYDRQDELGEVIQRFSQHWKLNRIAKIELTILRLALYEMIHNPDIPLKVAINEGVELAKKFGDENSRNFINGILDAAAKAASNGEFSVDKKI